MKKILMTGATGFIGRNILPILRSYFDTKLLEYGEQTSIVSPTRNELDITNKQNVDQYLENNSFDILLHFAESDPSHNPLDKTEKRFDNMVRAFLHFESHAGKFKKVIYTGSGAEYNKAYDIKMSAEEEIGNTIPKDDYGFAKYILNTIARKSENIYNMRLFGCYGPTDPQKKFITDAINSCLNGQAITIKQDCYFDYLYVADFAKIICWFIDNTPKYHDYNITTGNPFKLSSIAKIVADKMNNKKPIKILKSGLNNEYTASNKRLITEIGDFDFTTLSEGISKQAAIQCAPSIT
ncbi:MAG: dTDP-glucose 4,6-dehydratase [Termitinemataceae bacterium]|nr:MAG: dTDP-glucose 4,6-dehydratase [Termitinemataceae bacterium]